MKNKEKKIKVILFRWPHEAILLLIEEYRLRQNDPSSGKMSQKKIWALIAEELRKHMYNVTGPQCLSKLSGLKRTYKAIVDHNNKSGNSTRTGSYLSLMNELLGSKLFMSPISTVSLTGKRSRSPSSECSTSSFDSCSHKEENSQPKKARHTSNVERLVQTFKDERKIAEEAEQKRHEENVQLRQKLLNSFETMLNILEKK
ncbi:uncharacterized protein LOC112590673 [Harpegnathos saltator]|uniref:uncharacterized protein LOC112590673 n=1 Tax=Harpegnathos saltator TaxID=610380 RepID=UPI000DBEEFA5|nr:uncharacterized protein LOC112590673 [Harpegnathos saltator]